ncbi:40S ribosomal protein S15-like, partial [Zingiber officinale]|uniref:40S ribosomal protein S15-like n=1 Tax=Zingiber officinale TaxID=94328 RepID=UPI001C4C6B3A
NFNGNSVKIESSYHLLCINYTQKRDAPPGEKPEPVRTHLRNMIIVPEMIGSIVGVYNGKTFNQVEIKPEMIGHYLAEFSISYKPVKHGRPGIGATHSSRFIPLK